MKPSFILLCEVSKGHAEGVQPSPQRRDRFQRSPMMRHIYPLAGKAIQVPLHHIAPRVTWQFHPLHQITCKLPQHISYSRRIMNHQGRIVFEDLKVPKLLKNKLALKLVVFSIKEEKRNTAAWLQKVFRSDPENTRPVKVISVPSKTIQETINPQVKSNTNK